MLNQELAQAYQSLHQQETILKNLFLQKSQSFSYAKTVNMGSFAEDFRSLQDIRIEKQKELVKQAHRQVESIRILLIEKDRELKMIEKLKTKKAEVFFKEQERAEQREVDDQMASKRTRSV
jgi:flagellar export protein FliJ